MKEQVVIKILSVDDHPLMRDGIAMLINSQPDMVLVAEAANAEAALEQFRKHRPDITLMDLRIYGGSGIDAMKKIFAEFPEARIVMLTMFEGDVEIRRALEAGARGYLLKTMPPAELAQMIRRVHGGKKYIPPDIATQLAEHLGDENLTTREIEVLKLIAGGNRNKAIGEQLFISEETVKVHIKHIMEKLGSNDRTQSVAIAIQRGIIHL